MMVSSILILLFALLKITLTQITIRSPIELQNKFNGKIKLNTDVIKSSISNYGKVPYGQSLIGRLYYNVNNKELDYACKPLNGLDIEPETNLDRQPIVLVERGNCTFVTKTRMVQRIGGAVALIVDNKLEKNLENVIMTDDGTGSDIIIPTLMISKENGQKLIDFFMENKNNTEILSKIQIKLEFSIAHSEKVFFQLFFSSANKKIYRLIKEFYSYYVLLKNYTHFTPHYISHESKLYADDKDIQSDNCLSNGKYCASPRYDLNVFQGKYILLEDIRQKCLYNLVTPQGDSSIYFQYMIKFYDDCIAQVEPRFDYKCALEVLDSIGYDKEKVRQCMINSFGVDKESLLMFNNTNKLLENDYDAKSAWNVKMFPTIMVNNQTIHGASSAENLVEAVCAGMVTKPKICEDYLHYSVDNSSEASDFSFGTIWMIIIAVVLVNVMIVYICKRYIMRKIHERVERSVDIDGRINNVVTSYLALRDTK